ncbi:MAG: hypothetical protein HON14_14115 [Rhodospirillaceae bacterium]|nr:hypothetical protein [Rhodospirillaceae bacterium]MBT4589664.1 hypothetical protein [Rhodospirillaceae bacterium]MBT4940264.1 hypothetical protein [Rhodospirillaceae bacterium]MBT5940993.1 hypothetical protein [Rhodospirillaceae bacterium]MBT7268421.1 hypothetical protein [Rhodospirillaceae bacterium]
MSAETPQKTMSEIADDYEEEKLQELEDRLVARSLLYQLGDGAQPKQGKRGRLKPGQHLLMGDDPRLQEMPEKPTLLDFVRLRFTIGGQDHLLQSARLAANNGAPEKMVLACLLHDIAVSGFIRSDHGYWGAQLIEPYVDEEVSWAIRMHQCVRFFPDEDEGYEYPVVYHRMFGEDYKPEPYILEEYKRARAHKWYGSALMICKNDLYSFDPDVEVGWEEFEDILGRHFREPEEGLGNDNTSSSHMWRTLRRPCNAL